LILNSTYSNKEHKEIINDLVGKRYSIMEIIRFKGIGSKRMIIEEVSPNLSQYINFVPDVNYLQNFTWAIPYYQLVIYKTNGASLHAQGRYIHFKNNKTFKENKSFFKKMMDEKVKHDVQYNFY
jgi:hypothetical protein